MNTTILKNTILPFFCSMPSSNSPSWKDDVSAESRALRRKQKAETHFSSGCGYGKEKKRVIDIFWSSMWPSLEKLGWTKVRHLERLVVALPLLYYSGYCVVAYSTHSRTAGR